MSLASRKRFSSSFPLSSLADKCGAYFGVDTGEKVGNEVGNYFALATVFPSIKVCFTEQFVHWWIVINYKLSEKLEIFKVFNWEVE